MKFIIKLWGSLQYIYKSINISLFIQILFDLIQKNNTTAHLLTQIKHFIRKLMKITLMKH